VKVAATARWQNPRRSSLQTIFGQSHSGRHAPQALVKSTRKADNSRHAGVNVIATIQVILQGARIATYDVHDYPIVLQFGDQKTYDRATWFIPAFSLHIPAQRLSEIRSQQGHFSVLVDGPDGFRSGPYPSTWVRNYYPRGKDCAFIFVDPESSILSGVALSIAGGSLIIDQLDGTTPTPAGA